MNFLKKDHMGHYNGALYWIKSFSARSVEKFSIFPSEAESILLPTTQLKVIRKQPSSSHIGLYEIDMEEIHAVSASKYNTLKFICSDTKGFENKLILNINLSK